MSDGVSDAGTVRGMEIAVLVHDGVFDSGLASILDVLDQANAMAGELGDGLSWRVRRVGFHSEIRTGAGHLVAVEPVECAAETDLLVVPARAGRGPEEVLAYVAGHESLPVRNLIAQAHERGTRIASACAGTFLLAESGILDGLRATTT